MRNVNLRSASVKLSENRLTNGNEPSVSLFWGHSSYSGIGKLCHGVRIKITLLGVRLKSEALGLTFSVAARGLTVLK